MLVNCCEKKEVVASACSCCGGSAQASSHSGGDWGRLVWACVAAAQGMILSLALNVSDVDGGMRWLLHGALAAVAVAVAWLAGEPLWRAALLGWHERRVVAEHFFVIGMVAAFAVSLQSTLRGSGPLYYEVVAVLVAVNALGHLLGGRRRREFASLREAFGKDYSVCRVRVADGQYVERDVRDVKVEDFVLIEAGEVCSVDGVVVEGTALVEESTLTGEPFPVVKRVGDGVMAGCVARDSWLVVRVTAAGGQRVIDGILGAVEEASRNRTGLSAAADRLSQWLMPVVLVVATLSMAVWWWLTDFDTALMRALAVIVVACPCAMGLATPIGVWSALAAFARRGLVVFHGEVVERLALVNEVVFDKTGTLSEPGLLLVDWVVAEGEDGGVIRHAVELLEDRHHHPMAQAFRTKDIGQERFGVELLSSRVLPGCGVEGVFRLNVVEAIISVGNDGLLSRDDLNESAKSLRAVADAGKLTAWSHELFVLKNGRVVGLARLHELPREDAPEALSALSRLGLQLRVLTGDREQGLRKLGLDIDGESELTAVQKGERIGKRESSGRRVLYVGDGVNDASAMSKAFVSVAMGSGSSATFGQCSGVLNGRHLLPIAECIAIARRVVREVEGNMVIAVAYNTIGILLAATGLISPIFAAVLMLISSATVSLRAFHSARNVDQNALSRSGCSDVSKGGCGGDFAADSKASCSDSVVVPRAVAAVICLALWIQLPMLFWMAGLGSLSIALGIVLGSVLSLLLCQALVRGPLPRLRAWLAVMLGSGNLGMLIGWCGSWGFLPIVREGMCLCGCSASPFGEGIGLSFGWMHAGMLLGCAPMFFLLRTDGSSIWDGFQLGRCGFCFLGMLLGMNFAALLIGRMGFPTEQIQFFVNFGAMVCGMLLGMAVLEKVGEKILGFTTRSAVT